MKKSLLTVFLLSSLFSYSQTEIVFEYDEAGNQIYRGTQKTNTTTNNTTQSNTPSNLNAGMSAEEIEFWNNITYAPNEVIDDLFITLSIIYRDRISKIEMYDYVLGSQVYSVNVTSNTALRFAINMRAFRVGSYRLVFFLKNGKQYSQHILKR